MKNLTKLAFIGLVSGILIGCGGGSDDSNPVTGLTEEAVNDFAMQMAETGGCVYTPIDEAATSLDVSTIYKVTQQVTSGLQKNSLTSTKEVATDTETIPGDCGGSLTINETDTDTTYTFEEYCSTEWIDDAVFRANGTAVLAQLDTKTTVAINGDISVASTDPEEDISISMTNLFIEAQGTDFDTITMVDITADKLVITDNILKKTATITNLIAHYNPETGEITFNTDIITGDASLGALTAEGDLNIETGTGKATISDTLGNTAALVSTDTEDVFAVELNDKELGRMDCSEAETPFTATAL